MQTLLCAVGAIWLYAPCSKEPMLPTISKMYLKRYFVFVYAKEKEVSFVDCGGALTGLGLAN